MVGAERPAIVAGRPRPADLAHLGAGPARSDRQPVRRPARRRSTPAIAAFANLIRRPVRPDGHADLPQGRPPAEHQEPDRPPVRVRIKLTSEKLEFPDGSEQIAACSRPGTPRTVRRRDPRVGHLPGARHRHARPTAGSPSQRSRYTIRSIVREWRRHLPHRRRRPVPRDLVDHPLAPEPAPARHGPRRSRRDRPTSTGGAEPPARRGPAQSSVLGTAALARHRARSASPRSPRSASRC